MYISECFNLNTAGRKVEKSWSVMPQDLCRWAHGKWESHQYQETGTSYMLNTELIPTACCGCRSIAGFRKIKPSYPKEYDEQSGLGTAYASGSLYHTDGQQLKVLTRERNTLEKWLTSYPPPQPSTAGHPCRQHTRPTHCAGPRQIFSCNILSPKIPRKYPQN